MKLKKTLSLGISVLSTACGSTVFAHDGHGQVNTHWHATDAWGFVAMGVMLAVAIWLSRSGK